MTGFPISLASLGANTRTISAATPVSSARGWITCVQPVTNPEGSHGRYYLRVIVTNYQANVTPASAAELASKTIAVIWSGYVCPGCPSSLPNYKIPTGASLVLDWTSGSNGATTDVLTVAIETDETAPIQAPWIFTEAPGSGQGDLNVVTLTVAGNGKDPNNGSAKLFPTGVRVKWVGAALNLVTSATAGSREVNVSVQSAGGVELDGGGVDVLIGPSVSTGAFMRCTGRGGTRKTPLPGDTAIAVTVWTLTGTVPQGPYPGPTPNFNATGAVASTGFFYIWNTRNLDTNVSTGDLYSGIRMCFEEWASPTP